MTHLIFVSLWVGVALTVVGFPRKLLPGVALHPGLPVPPPVHLQKARGYDVMLHVHMAGRIQSIMSMAVC